MLPSLVQLNVGAVVPNTYPAERSIKLSDTVTEEDLYRNVVKYINTTVLKALDELLNDLALILPSRGYVDNKIRIECPAIDVFLIG